MGAGASTLSDLDAMMVAEHIAKMPNQKVQEYSKNFREYEIDGDILSELKPDEVDTMLVSIGVDNMLHRKKFAAELKKCKEKFSSPSSRSTQEEEIGKFETSTKFFAFGGNDAFLGGLKIPGFYRSIETECLENDNGKWAREYEYVVNEPAKEIPDRNMPSQIRDDGNEGKRLEDFCAHGIALKAELTPAEVATLRMYTGPFYAPWNRALRLSTVDPTLLESWATCISVLYSAI
jgi:hypothetical protein